jgi:hypothetical protein
VCAYPTLICNNVKAVITQLGLILCTNGASQNVVASDSRAATSVQCLSLCVLRAAQFSALSMAHFLVRMPTPQHVRYSFGDNTHMKILLFIRTWNELCEPFPALGKVVTTRFHQLKVIIHLQHKGPMIGNDREISNYTPAIAK